jgi:protein ImuA
MKCMGKAMIARPAWPLPWDWGQRSRWPGAGGAGRVAPALALYGEGVAALGIDPARLVLAQARDAAALLRAGLEGARCPGLALVLLESEGPLKGYDLTASRRFVLAAERTQTPVVLLRHAARAQASAAHTRWQVSSAPSQPLEAPPGAQVRPPGLPALAVEATLAGWAGGADMAFAMG